MKFELVNEETSELIVPNSVSTSQEVFLDSLLKEEALCPKRNLRASTYCRMIERYCQMDATNTKIKSSAQRSTIAKSQKAKGSAEDSNKRDDSQNLTKLPLTFKRQTLKPLCYQGLRSTFYQKTINDSPFEFEFEDGNEEDSEKLKRNVNSKRLYDVITTGIPAVKLYDSFLERSANTHISGRKK